MKQSQSWKDLERFAAKRLKGDRVVRGGDFSKSDVDVVVDDFPRMRVDCKYRKAHAFHGLVEEIREKYCKDMGQFPVMVTRHKNGKNVYVTLDLESYAMLLDMIREED